MRQQAHHRSDDDEDQPLSAEVPRPPHRDLDLDKTEDVDLDKIPNTGEVKKPPTGEAPEPPD